MKFCLFLEVCKRVIINEITPYRPNITFHREHQNPFFNLKTNWQPSKEHKPMFYWFSLSYFRRGVFKDPV